MAAAAAASLSIYSGMTAWSSLQAVAAAERSRVWPGGPVQPGARRREEGASERGGVVDYRPGGLLRAGGEGVGLTVYAGGLLAGCSENGLARLSERVYTNA